MANTGAYCLLPSEIESRLQEAGINPTAQRIAICRYVLCEADHPTPEEVKAWVDQNFPKLSLTTVYNTLRTLVEVGLLQEFRFSHTDTSVYDCNVSKHYHFVDLETGKITDIQPEKVKIEAGLGGGLIAEDYELVIRGKTMGIAKDPVP